MSDVEAAHHQKVSADFVASTTPTTMGNSADDDDEDSILENPFVREASALSLEASDEDLPTPLLLSGDNAVLTFGDGSCSTTTTTMATPPQLHPSTKNIPYYKRVGDSADGVAEDRTYLTDHKRQLDVHVPTCVTASSPRPVYFHVHGGGWKRGDRQIPFYGAPSLAHFTCDALGLVSVTPSYRLGRYPTFMHDLVAALCWTVEHIASYGGDPRRVILSGHSAGAHMIALLLLRGVETYGLPRHIREGCIRGVVLISGVYSLEAPMYHRRHYPRNVIFRSAYVKGSFGVDPLLIDGASPSVALLRCGAVANTLGSPRCCVGSTTVDEPAAPPHPETKSKASSTCWLSSIFSCKRESGEKEPRASNGSVDEAHEPATAVAAEQSDPSTSVDSDCKEKDNKVPNLDASSPCPSPPFPVATNRADIAASERWTFPDVLHKIPFLVLNASCDLGLEVDGAMFAKLLLSMGGIHRGLTSPSWVTYETIPSTNHASICWDNKTHARISLFLRQNNIIDVAPATSAVADAVV
jgi:acetyl esterase/lipase